MQSECSFLNQVKFEQESSFEVMVQTKTQHTLNEKILEVKREQVAPPILKLLAYGLSIIHDLPLTKEVKYL